MKNITAIDNKYFSSYGDYKAQVKKSENYYISVVI